MGEDTVGVNERTNQESSEGTERLEKETQGAEHTRHKRDALQAGRESRPWFVMFFCFVLFCFLMNGLHFQCALIIQCIYALHLLN